MVERRSARSGYDAPEPPAVSEPAAPAAPPRAPARTVPPRRVRLAGGRFAMGTPAADVERLRRVYGVRRRELFAPEVPRHAVVLAPFALDAHPVTNRQFAAFLAACPAWRP